MRYEEVSEGRGSNTSSSSIRVLVGSGGRRVQVPSPQVVLAGGFALLILGSMVVFLLMRVIPGDPTITKLGGSIKEVDQATLDGIRE